MIIIMIIIIHVTTNNYCPDPYASSVGSSAALTEYLAVFHSTMSIRQKSLCRGAQNIRD